MERKGHLGVKKWLPFKNLSKGFLYRLQSDVSTLKNGLKKPTFWSSVILFSNNLDYQSPPSF